jgi:hypothetical protein
MTEFKHLNSKLKSLSEGIDPPAHKINPDYVQQTGNPRKCIQCDKLHDTIVEDMQTGNRLEELEKCRDCMMISCFFNPIQDHSILKN